MADHVITTDISNVSKAYAILGGFIVIYGLISYIAKDRLYLSEPLIAVCIGIITGPSVLGWIDPLSWGSTEHTNYVTYELTRLVVGVQVLFTGITMPKAYLRKEALSLTVLLAGVMTVTWFVSSLLIWGLIVDLTFLEALAIGAAITPTDPVLSSSIIRGRFAERYLPVNLRNIILAESGANDGLGFPFLFLALYLSARTGEDKGLSIGSEIGRWVYGVVLYRVVLSCVYGALIGFLAHKTLKWAETRGYIDRDNFFAYGFGLALFTLGTTGLFNSDDILACYVAGNVFTWKDWYRVRTQVEEEDSFQDIIDSLLNAAVFIYVGAIIPWADYNTGGEALNIEPWRIVVLGLTILLVRRLPWVLAMYKAIPAISNFSEAVFAGWFGPIGVAAVFYIQIALREIPDDGTRDRLRAVYNPVVMFCVFSSVLGHGMTIPLVKLGPKLVRSTTSFSQSRTISLTAKPTKEAVPSSTSGEATEPRRTDEKVVWNPFYALAGALKSVLLFWRTESIWRRENEHLRKHRQLMVSADRISKPMRGKKMATMEDSSGSEPDVNLGGETSTASADHEGQEIVKPEPTANPKDKEGITVAAEGFVSGVQRALENELRREREEAAHEATHTVHAPIRATRLVQMSKPNSAPGTPGRVHFEAPGSEQRL
jgi:NhaP-type Na+/H+ or K+/H+ antiporter